MTPKDLADFITENVPVFDNIGEMEAGRAFHYTGQRAGIEQSRMFFGAEITSDLDHTQVALISPPATHDPGVVFAYEYLKDSAEEGDKCDIIELEYARALKATHSQEASLGAPPTLLILNRDITRFRYLGVGCDLFADPDSAVPGEWIACIFRAESDANPTLS